MSLRVRLLAGIVALVTIGLTVAAAVTYAEQRSFLNSRLDQEVASARLPIIAQLAREQVGLPPGLERRDGRLRFGPGEGPRIAQQLPPGTFGELLGAGGRLLAPAVGYSFGGATIHAPPLPKHYPVSTPGRPLRLFTFTSGGVRYRAVAMGIGLLSGTLFIAVPRRDVDQTLHRLVVVELLVGTGVILALLVLGWFVIRVGLRPLERIRTVATEIAHGDLSRRVSPADGRTEVGRLGVSLNEMLGQIERAFAARSDSENRLREFLADASHELRTPLAAVRGYAELYRLGAAREPADVERSMARIEAEAARMGGIVENLLTLARLDELPEAEFKAVDVTELAAHAAADARAMAQEHELTFSSDGPNWVVADPDAVRQVLANLLRNASIHTPPGTAIELRVFARDGRVILEVRDHGPGLPEGAGDEVFERFWRNERGRTRGPGGAGLGLAIVKAIVAAHHGEVHADDAPGGGARFTVTLPASNSANAQPPPTERIADSARVRP